MREGREGNEGVREGKGVREGGRGGIESGSEGVS